MKLHLPLVLLSALLSSIAFGGGTYVTTEVINVTNVDEEVKMSENADIKTQLTHDLTSPDSPFFGNSNSDTPKAVVKDGQGTLVIDEDIDMYNPLVVREGTTVISEATVKNYNKLSNGVSNLSVGGNNAHLKLDGATYKQDLDYNQNYVSAIAIGNTDGAGKVTLENGSLLHTDQFIFAGYKSITNGYVTSSSISPSDSSQYSGGVEGRSEINILSGSTLSAGTCLQFANVDVNISGEGSRMVDLNRDSGKAPADWSYLGTAADSRTVINIEDGGSLDLQQSTVLVYGDNAETVINVSGQSENGVKSCANITNAAYAGYYGTGNKFTLNVENGATANVDYMYLGNNAQISVDETSGINAVEGAKYGYINVYSGAEVRNAGCMNTDIMLQGGALYSYDGSTLGNVYLVSGMMEVQGAVTLSGSLVGYDADGATLNVQELGSISADGTVTVSKGVTIELTESGSRSVAVITLGAEGSCSFESGAAVILSLTDSYLSQLVQASNTVSVMMADKEATATDASITVNGDSNILWDIDVDSFGWESADGKTYINGTVNAVTEVQVSEEGELSTSITDVADGTQRSLTVKETTVTLSGDNTHTGGTTVTDATVTLGSATALGKGGVTTIGTVDINTGEGVTAELCCPIQNKGTLTLNGSYDASSLTTETINETWLDTNLQSGVNGFYRHEGSSLRLVENENGTISETSAPTITHENGLTYKLDTATGQAVAEGKTLWDTYHINTEDHTASVSEIAAASENQLEQVEMKAGVLHADVSAKVNATGGSIHMTGQDVHITGTLSGNTSVLVLGIGTITGDNTYTGGTVIAGENAKLTVGSATALGTGEVYLKDHGTLDLNGMEVSNVINVLGCTISRAGNYRGELRVSGDLALTGATQAAAVTLAGNGTVSGAQLTTGSITKDGGHSAPVDFNCPVVVLEGGDIFINGDTPLSVSGSLTLGNKVTIHLSDGFSLNDTIVDAEKLILTNGTASIELEGTRYELTLNKKDGDLVLKEKEESTPGEDDTPIVDEDPEEDTPIVDEDPEEDTPIVDVEPEPVPVFDQATADVLAQSNWGIVSASRAFVDTVQGQRNNMGCIANGRGTAWASLIGGMTDISGSAVKSGSDITLFGAAVGVDMKLGKRSSLGVAFGYTDGEVATDGLGEIDQETGHIALYGEHGLKKFANDSCLRLDWVAATGTTESKYMGAKWEQDSVQLNTRLTWSKKVTDRLSYNVFGGLEYFASDSDRVQNCKSGSVQNLRGELGAGVRYVAAGSTRTAVDEKSGLAYAAPGCERVVLYGEVRYMNDMVRNNPSIEVDGLRGSGANPGRQGVGVEAGTNIRIGERWSVNANYSFNAMDDSNEHILNIGASRSF